MPGRPAPQRYELLLRNECSPRRRLVRDSVKLTAAVELVHPLHLFLIERTRTAAVEHRVLIAALVHSPVAVDTFGYRERRTRSLECRNKLRNRLRTEALVVRGFVRPKELHD